MVKEFENYNSDSELELFSDSDNDSLEDFHYNFGMLNVENKDEDELHNFRMMKPKALEIIAEYGKNVVDTNKVIYLDDDQLKGFVTLCYTDIRASTEEVIVQFRQDKKRTQALRSFINDLVKSHYTATLHAFPQATRDQHAALLADIENHEAILSNFYTTLTIFCMEAINEKNTELNLFAEKSTSVLAATVAVASTAANRIGAIRHEDVESTNAGILQGICTAAICTIQALDAVTIAATGVLIILFPTLLLLIEVAKNALLSGQLYDILAAASKGIVASAVMIKGWSFLLLCMAPVMFIIWMINKGNEGDYIKARYKADTFLEFFEKNSAVFSWLLWFVNWCKSFQLLDKMINLDPANPSLFGITTIVEKVIGGGRNLGSYLLKGFAGMCNALGISTVWMVVSPVKNIFRDMFYWAKQRYGKQLTRGDALCILLDAHNYMCDEHQQFRPVNCGNFQSILEHRRAGGRRVRTRNAMKFRMDNKCKRRLQDEGLFEIAESDQYSLSGTFVKFVMENKMAMLAQIITNVIYIDKLAFETYKNKNRYNMAKFESQFDALYIKLETFLQIILAILFRYNIVDEQIEYDKYDIDVRDVGVGAGKVRRSMTTGPDELGDEVQNVCTNLGNFLLRGLENLGAIQNSLRASRINIGDQYIRVQPIKGDFVDYPKDGIVSLTWPQLAAESEEEAMSAGAAEPDALDYGNLDTDRYPTYRYIANCLVYKQYSWKTAPLYLFKIQENDVDAPEVDLQSRALVRSKSAPHFSMRDKNDVYLIHMPANKMEVIIMRDGDEVSVEKTSMNKILSMI